MNCVKISVQIKYNDVKMQVKIKHELFSSKPSSNKALLG